MTPREFSYEFDIFYNNIRSASAPGIDNYEKSVLLTESQEEIVRQIINPTAEYAKGIEDIELHRRYLDILTKQFISVDKDESFEKIAPNSTFFTIPLELYLIINERLLITSEIECYNNKTIDVVPITHDEYNSTRKNPFKKPKLGGVTIQAWRLDYGPISGKRKVEIIYPEDSTPIQYIVRYLRKPRPIILSDLTTDGLSIDGETDEQTSELDDSLHRQILLNAVQKAKMIYDPKVN